MDARNRLKRLLAIPSFAEFCERVCRATADFTRCSIAIWDSDGEQRTERWMYHSVCKSLYGNLEVRSAHCDQSDKRTVDAVLSSGVRAAYTCWAGFRCEMIPILAWDQTVGLISIGEFFTPQCNQLLQIALDKAGPDAPTILKEMESGRIPLLQEEHQHGVRTAVQHLAEIIGDLVTARINPQTLPAYLSKVASQMATLWAGSVDEGSRLAAALDGFALVSLANLFFEDVHTFLQQHRDRALHEALTPLSTIFAQAEALPKESTQRDKIIAAAKRIDRDARSLLAETNVLDGSWWKLTPEPLKPKDLAHEIYFEYQTRRELGDQLIVSAEPGMVRVDLSLARFVAGELVNNAFKATRPGERRIHVALDVLSEDLRIEVSDNGCGIPVEQVSRIFENGIRLEQRGYGIGTGHGLYKLRENVWFVGGSVAVAPSESGGSVFEVVLPGFSPLGEES